MVTSFRLPFFVPILLSALATTAAAGTIRVPLPELLGDYVLDDNALGISWGVSRYLSVPTAVSHFGAQTATIELKGTVTHGLVKGDGIVRANVDTILDGAFGVSFQPTDQVGIISIANCYRMATSRKHGHSQDRDGKLSRRERREAQALTQLVDMLALMRLRAKRAAGRNGH